MMRLLFFISIFLISINATTQSILPDLLSERDRARVVDDILEDRVDNLLPELMAREDLDMWIIISREYNEDPIMKTFLPSTWLSARRRTIMVFYRSEDQFDRIAIARYSVGKLLKGSWDIDIYPDQWEALVKIIEERDPATIGLNYSSDFGLADGLVKTEYDAFLSKLPQKYHPRLRSAQNLAIAWLETRSEKELQIYPLICNMARKIIREGLSERVIHPGITTTDDVVWWLRERVTELGLNTWFHPSVSLQRSSMGNNEFLRSFSNRPKEQIIQYGDLLHVDFGITYLRLNTDQQQHFYILKPGEKAPPEGLVKAFENGNRVQEILTSHFKKGSTGNEILKATLDQAKAEGLNASIYTHPIGFHGHGAGPTIGLWDQQGGVKGRGDYPLFENTAYSIELFAATEVAEWGKIVRIMLEEDGVFDGEQFYFLDGRQKELYLIPEPNPLLGK